MANDLSKSQKQIILDLVNQTSLKPITEAMVTFGPPVVDNGTKNTSLTLTAVEGSGYTGSQTIKYNRVSMQTGMVDVYLASPGATPLEFNLGDAATIVDFLPEINALLGVNIQPSDIVDGPLPEFAGDPNEEHTVTVTAHQDSLIYKDTFTFVVKAEDMELADVITTTEMDGLTYAAPAQGGA